MAGLSSLEKKKKKNPLLLGNIIPSVHLVVAPKPGQAVWVHDAEDFALCILPADVVLVPAVRQELVDVVPQQPAV